MLGSIKKEPQLVWIDGAFIDEEQLSNFEQTSQSYKWRNKQYVKFELKGLVVNLSLYAVLEDCCALAFLLALIHGIFALRKDLRLAFIFQVFHREGYASTENPRRHSIYSRKASSKGAAILRDSIAADRRGGRSLPWRRRRAGNLGRRSPQIAGPLLAPATF